MKTTHLMLPPATVRVHVRAQRDPKVLDSNCTVETNSVTGSRKLACQLQPGDTFVYNGVRYDVIAVDSGHPWEALPAYLGTNTYGIGYVEGVDAVARAAQYSVPIEVTGSAELAQAVANALNSDPVTFAHANVSVGSTP